ncbi:MAG: hypothetical protein ACI87E_004757, partial [Mariniblastus sp.]
VELVKGNLTVPRSTTNQTPTPLSPQIRTNTYCHVIKPNPNLRGEGLGVWGFNVQKKR